MNWQGTRSSLKHLGTLHGQGDLSLDNGEHTLGVVTYEIDCYARRMLRSDNGQIDGRADLLAQAFRAGTACIALEDGQFIDVVLSDPRGGPTAEVRVSGRFPRFGEDAEIPEAEAPSA
jgi:hypothetical protein